MFGGFWRVVFSEQTIFNLKESWSRRGGKRTSCQLKEGVMDMVAKLNEQGSKLVKKELGRKEGTRRCGVCAV